jgi:lysophospholipid acyltransferase (LPLAT)-like uncharacterized protein
MKRFLAWLSSLIIRLIVATLRVTIVDRGGILDRPDHPPVIIAFWHNRVFLMAPYYERYCHGRTGLTFISRSRDGDFMSNVAACFGVQAVRGSSSRHGISAALTALRASPDERLDIVITPDGPRGPRCEVQPGVLRIAQATGRPIVTVTTHLQWKRVLQSWDRFEVPLPFSRCELIAGERIYVPDGATAEELAVIAERLAASLDGLPPGESRHSERSNHN